MRFELYPKLAFDSIRKNKKTYFPFILTCTVVVAIFYIMNYLQLDEVLADLPGSVTIQSMLNIGSNIIIFFSVIFIFYTNSSLLKNRKKELGLYSILGMGKKNLLYILFWENLYLAFISIGLGLIFGIAFSKIAELLMNNIIHTNVKFSFFISSQAIILTLIVYGSIFLLLFLNAVYQISITKTIALINSDKVGEKPPKGNWALSLIGILLLVGAYFLSSTIEDPVAALTYFFLAVSMVIIGTYLIMISASVFLCRLLQKNEDYYYKTNHFISISSMAYRMKRNGAGLASICILVTMVLFMISSTASLYFGSEEILNSRYPRDINLSFIFDNYQNLNEENINNLTQTIDSIVDENKAQYEDLENYKNIEFLGVVEGNNIRVYNEEETIGHQDTTDIYIVPLESYNRIYNQNQTLGNHEILFSIDKGNYDFDTVKFNNLEEFTITKRVKEVFYEGVAVANIIPSMLIVTPDFDEIAPQLENPYTNYRYTFNFNTNLDETKENNLYNQLYDFVIGDQFKQDYSIKRSIAENRNVERQYFYYIYGGIFFLGILLSIIFLVATILIIYYKQLSEGLEDKSRFEIMQKIGLTKREIRSSINSQILTVFFLPLALAIVHIIFAFPIVNKLLMLFGLNNPLVFALATASSILIFGLFYIIVYRITSNTYYKIVS